MTERIVPAAGSPEVTPGPAIDWTEFKLVRVFEDSQGPKPEWRRLFSELLGTFFLVLVAAGGAMMSQAFPGTVSRDAAVAAPGLMVLAIILFMGKVSGAHLNPVVSLAFAARADFPWRRVPGYIAAQLIGASLAGLFLQEVIGVSATFGSNYPAAGHSAGSAFWMEFILTLGLVSVILGTASGAQNVGLLGAFGVGFYIALAGLWASPISGASMNPARTFGPDLVGGILERADPTRRRSSRDRDLDRWIERSGNARCSGPQVALATTASRGRPELGSPEPGDGHQRPGLLGEVLHHQLSRWPGADDGDQLLAAG
ncbi:MAG: aquaporin [Acidimicrobiales bacterium]